MQVRIQYQYMYISWVAVVINSEVGMNKKGGDLSPVSLRIEGSYERNYCMLGKVSEVGGP